MSVSPPYGVLAAGGNCTHQESYARTLAADPRCRLLAVTDERDVPERRRRLNQQLADELEVPYIDDLDAALARDDAQIVSVCVEHERRARVAVRCAEAGKHLYVDKPTSCSVAGARAIAAAVERHGVQAQMFSMVHAPWVQDARRALEAGVVGELLALHCNVMFAKGHPGTAPLGQPRLQDPDPQQFTFIDSKRELRATGVYALGIIRYLTGREVRSVHGTTANYFFREHYDNGAEDFGTLSLTLEGGLIASVMAARIGWQSHAAGGPLDLTLVGTEGTLRVDAHQPRLEVSSTEPSWQPPDPDPEDPMGFWRSSQIRSGIEPKQQWLPLGGKGDGPGDETHFLDSLERGEPCVLSVRDGAALVETLAAGYQSAATGQVVDLPLP